MYNDLFLCTNKVAVVTGGAGLIGQEIVKGLSDFGAKVYLADIDREKANEIGGGTGIEFVYLDVTSEPSIDDCMKSITAREDRIDILVNSAYPRTRDWGKRFEDISFKSWTENMNYQLGGYFLCCQKAAEQMKKQQSGSIINIASTYGVVAPDFSIYEGTEMTMPAVYSAIKGGLITFTKYLASYYSPYNVRINAISPGGIFNHQPSAFVEKYSKKTPLGRMGKASEIVGAAVYLASEASAYMTGHNMMVDGGWTIW